MACLLAGGHLLIEDVPGVGETTLALALARAFGLQYSRVQITADLVPITRGSTIHANGTTYTVVSEPNVQDWTTAQVLWAVSR